MGRRIIERGWDLVRSAATPRVLPLTVLDVLTPPRPALVPMQRRPID